MITTELMGPGFFIFFQIETETIEGGTIPGKAKRKFVYIDGEKVFFDTKQQLLMLLEAYRQEQMDSMVQAAIKKNTRKVKLIATQIKRTETRIKNAGGHPWLEEEELLLLLI